MVEDLHLNCRHQLSMICWFKCVSNETGLIHFDDCQYKLFNTVGGYIHYQNDRIPGLPGLDIVVHHL